MIKCKATISLPSNRTVETHVEADSVMEIFRLVSESFLGGARISSYVFNNSDSKDPYYTTSGFNWRVTLREDCNPTIQEKEVSEQKKEKTMTKSKQLYYFIAIEDGIDRYGQDDFKDWYPTPYSRPNRYYGFLVINSMFYCTNHINGQLHNGDILSLHAEQINGVITVNGYKLIKLINHKPIKDFPFYPNLIEVGVNLLRKER